MLHYFVNILLLLGILTTTVGYTDQHLTNEVNANRQPIEQHIYDTQQDPQVLSEWQWVKQQN